MPVASNALQLLRVKTMASTAYNVDAYRSTALACYINANTAIAAPARLRGAVRRMLRSPAQVGSEHRLTRGRFDRRAIVRATMGRQDVCARRFYIPGQNVALTLLVDLSSSMAYTRVRAATALAIVLSKCAEQAGA